MSGELLVTLLSHASPHASVHVHVACDVSMCTVGGTACVPTHPILAATLAGAIFFHMCYQPACQPSKLLPTLKGAIPTLSGTVSTPRPCGAQGARGGKLSGKPMCFYFSVLALLAAAASGLPLPAENTVLTQGRAANNANGRGRELEVCASCNIKFKCTHNTATLKHSVL